MYLCAYNCGSTISNLPIISPLSLIQKSNPDDLFEGIFIEMIGIYKITNPNGKVYIGQSVCS